MKVLLINSVCGTGSTGKICAEIAEQYEKEGHEVKIAYGRFDNVPEKYKKYAVRIGTDIDLKVHALKTRIMDKHGLGSKTATKKFLEWAEDYAPDIVWLHNIHGYYINYEMLFAWIKKHPDMKVNWTLHDCWAFTGHCSHFTVVKCKQWKSQCVKCVQKKRYPSALLIDNCKNNFKRKESAFTGVKNMTLITPSNWLAELVKQSFLSEYPVEVRYNTINTEIFKPTPGNFREKYGLSGKKIILGVANVWDERKGLNDFLKLRVRLSDKFVVVLIGLNKKQIQQLPNGVIGIERTSNQTELAEIYTTSDLLLSLSKEETFGMTVLEAISCGTQALVLKGTACEEIVKKYGGIACFDDINEIYSKIVFLLQDTK